MAQLPWEQVAPTFGSCELQKMHYCGICSICCDESGSPLPVDAFNVEPRCRRNRRTELLNRGCARASDLRQLAYMQV